jgi:hypothetical protein
MESSTDLHLEHPKPLVAFFVATHDGAEDVAGVRVHGVISYDYAPFRFPFQVTLKNQNFDESGASYCSTPNFGSRLC